MKKVLSYILISLIISANLFAPFSVGWSKNKVEIKKNEVNAAPGDPVNTTGQPTLGQNIMKISALGENTDTTATVTAKISSDSDASTVFIGGSVTFDIEATLLKVNSDGTQTKVGDTITKLIDKNSFTKDQIFSFTGLTPSTSYTISIIINKLLITSVPGATIPPEITKLGELTPQLTFKTNDINVQTVTKIGKTGINQTDGSDPATMPACVFGSPLKGTFGGCMAQALYYMVFVPSSYLFAMSGIFFDSSFAYSVQDSSYRSAFVVQGWGLVRDFCNLFFIFIMLYIAIGTILNLSSVKTKETIINVVIIGLFINFSLFATQIIIDASNITARVFYNSNAITITEKGVTGATNVVSKIGEGGVIPISAALVNKINPQNLILNAGKINDVVDTGGSSATDQSEQKDFNSGNASFTAGTFALIVIMTSAVNIVGFVVFITVGFLFFARVIGLWLAMILAPLAFFTYILPEMSSIKMIGWKNWWPETLKMAFLAPVFIFFMYLILKFLEMDLISDAQGKSGVAFFVAGMIPFVFIMIFMIKAKKIATDMSGEFGEMVTKVGGAVSGMVLGGAVGMGAMAMRGTIGKVGEKLDKNSWVNKMAGSKNVFAGFIGNKLKDTGQKVASKSFDARNTEMGAAGGKWMGSDIGKGKEGGYTKDRKDFVERKQKRAKEIEVNEDEELTQAVNRAEITLQHMLNEVAGDFDSIDKQLAAQRQKKLDADPTDTRLDPITGKNDFYSSVDEIKRLNTLKKNIKTANGSNATANNTAATNAANAVTASIAAGGVAGNPTHDALVKNANELAAIVKADTASLATGGKSIMDMETKIIPDAKNAKLTESRRRTTGFANATAFWGTNARMEAQHKIIMETKLDSGTKT